jgi:hypothetical protein
MTNMQHAGVRAAIAAAIVCVAMTGTARAQSAEAEALFNDADKLMTDGKLGAACDAFEASNRIEARAGTLIRLGDCREKNGQLASAWSAYKDALTRVKDPKKRELAVAGVARIEPRLSFLTVSVPDESRVDGLAILKNGKELDPALWNRAIPVDGGAYKITGRAPGHEDWSTDVTVPVEGGKTTVDVPKFKELTKLVDPVPGEVVDKHADLAQPEGGGTFTGKRQLAVGVGAAGIVAIGIGAVMGMGAKSAQDDAYALCPDPAAPCAHAAEANDKIQSGKSKALYANVGYGVGIAALAGAAFLWFTGAPESSHAVSVVPHLGDRSGVDVMVRF